MSIISGTVGAILGSDAQNKATDTNAQNVQNTNAQNLEQFHEARGSTGSAIYPTYASGADAQLFGDAQTVYDATGALAPTGANYQAIVDGAAPGAAGATTAANNVFNGQTLNTELGNQQPVSAANLELAQTQKQSSLEALQSTLNNIKAIQAGKGYAGDSFQNSLLRFNATQQANAAGAGAIATAKLQNATADQGIKENAINRELANLNAPGTAATQQINLARAPVDALNQQQVSRQNLFANFRIGPGAPFQYQPLPTVQPNSAAYGAVANAGAAGNALANAYINNPSGVNSLVGGSNNGANPGPGVPYTNTSGAVTSTDVPYGEDLAAQEAL